MKCEYCGRHDCAEHARGEFLAPKLWGICARIGTPDWYLNEEVRTEIATDLRRIALTLERM